MKLYNAKILLAGNNANQVRKERLTAAEIKVLEFIHQGELPSVIEIEHVADTTRTDRQERARLLTIYGEWGMGKGADMLHRLFGVEGIPLPKEYEPPTVTTAAEAFDEPDPDEVITPLTGPVATRGKAAAKLKAEVTKPTEAEALAG